eukprot:sb/3463890/
MWLAGGLSFILLLAEFSSSEQAIYPEQANIESNQPIATQPATGSANESPATGSAKEKSANERPSKRSTNESPATRSANDSPATGLANDSPATRSAKERPSKRSANANESQVTGTDEENSQIEDEKEEVVDYGGESSLPALLYRDPWELPSWLSCFKPVTYLETIMRTVKTYTGTDLTQCAEYCVVDDKCEYVTFHLLTGRCDIRNNVVWFVTGKEIHKASVLTGNRVCIQYRQPSCALSIAKMVAESQKRSLNLMYEESIDDRQVNRNCLNRDDNNSTGIKWGTCGKDAGVWNFTIVLKLSELNTTLHEATLQARLQGTELCMSHIINPQTQEDTVVTLETCQNPPPISQQFLVQSFLCTFTFNMPTNVSDSGLMEAHAPLSGRLVVISPAVVRDERRPCSGTLEPKYGELRGNLSAFDTIMAGMVVEIECPGRDFIYMSRCYDTILAPLIKCNDTGVVQEVDQGSRIPVYIVYTSFGVSGLFVTSLMVVGAIVLGKIIAERKIPATRPTDSSVVE